MPRRGVVARWVWAPGETPWRPLPGARACVARTPTPYHPNYSLLGFRVFYSPPPPYQRGSLASRRSCAGAPRRINIVFANIESAEHSAPGGTRWRARALPLPLAPSTLRCRFSDCDNASWERACARCRRSALREKHGFAILARDWICARARFPRSPERFCCYTRCRQYTPNAYGLRAHARCCSSALQDILGL